MSDTIVAPLCGSNSAGSVQILRISGSKTASILEQIVSSPATVLKNSHQVSLKKIINPKTSEVIDQALVVFFKSPRSYTGEDCAELHLHASSYIVNEMLTVVTSLGARAAEAGEFTKRAFLNGQIDLLQAEAVADLIAAQTKSQADLARQQLSGRLSNVLDSIGEPLRDLLATIEAHIDFPEEEIELEVSSAWSKSLTLVINKLEQLLATYTTGRISRDGAQVVLAGVPNVGKSSILNALAKEERAIVTSIAGTTRDSIEQRISLMGYAISLWDTAGLALSTQRTIEEIEQIGIERSWLKIANADLVLFVLDLTQEIKTQSNFLEEIKSKTSANILIIINKQDLVNTELSKKILELKPLLISARKNTNIDKLEAKIIDSLNLKPNRDLALLNNQRHKDAVGPALEKLIKARNLMLENTEKIELIAFEIRSALLNLSELVGVTENEDILGRIFSKFCIGK